MSGLQPDQVRVAPGAGGPRGDVPQILVELEVLQLVVEELADVPREVVMTVD